MAWISHCEICRREKDSKIIMHKIRVSICFYGRVQGVGFRYKLRYLAEKYSVTGWARNEYDGSVSTELQGLEEDAPVIYIGTFSKTLFPSLRIGFMVLPPALVESAQPAIRALLRGGHRAEQCALARFIEEGHYTRHLAAMRRLYRKRQSQLHEALAQELTIPHRVMAGEGGLHLTVVIEGIDDVALVRLAHQHQLAPSALSTFYLNRQHARSGLVLGYGNTSASQFATAIRTLQRLIAQLQNGSG